MEDKASPTPEEAMNLLVQKEEVSELLNALNDREKQVIRLRYGLEDGKNPYAGRNWRRAEGDKRTCASDRVPCNGKA